MLSRSCGGCATIHRMPTAHTPAGFERRIENTIPSEVFTTAPTYRRPSVIADANALISDSMRSTRGLPCIMPTLARGGVVNLVTAEHIDAKVYTRLPQACQNSHTDLAAATQAYETILRPLLRLVAVGDLMMDDPRVSAVALVDEEDRAVAQLAVLLAPSMVLTMDKHLIAAGLGVREWADALHKLKYLAEVDDLVWGTASGAAIGMYLSILGVVEFGRLLARSPVALGLTLGAVLSALLFYRDEVRAWPGRVRQRAGPVLDQAVAKTAELFERRDEMHQLIEPKLVLPMPDETLEAMVARVLIQRREPLRADQVHAQLPYSWRDAYETEDVMDALRSEPPFRLVRGRGWLFGRPAVAGSQVPVARSLPQLLLER